MAKAITLKQHKAVRRVVDVLRGQGRLRGFISKRSEENLQRHAVEQPGRTRSFLKNLLRLERLAVPVVKIVVPESLSDFQNRELFDRLAEMGFLFKLIDRDGWLDLRRAGLKREIGHKDLTSEFEEFQIFEEIRESYQGKNREIIEKDLEINNITLFYCLWMIRILLYKIGEQTAAAVREKNPTDWHNARAVMVQLAKFMEEFSNDYPFLENNIQKRIIKAAELLRRFNNPAADAVLVPATEQLEKVIEGRERSRIQRERRSRKRKPANIFEEELMHLAQRRYNISFSPEGTWVIPQAGFRRVGPVLQRQVISHNVDAEKVVRREDHKIDSITEKIAVNAHFKSLFDGVIRTFKFSRQINYEQVLSVIAKGFLAYEKGIVRPKFKTRLMLKLVLELVKTASICHDNKAEGRLLRFAGSMLGAVVNELVALNENLGNQLRRIAIKKRLALEIVAQNMVRDTNLRTLSEMLIDSLTNKRVMNSARLAWDLRQLAVDAREVLRINKEAEIGVQRCGKRINHLINLFAKVRRLIQEKEKLRRKYKEARERYKIELDNIKAAGRNEMLPILREKGIEYAREKLESIKRLNAEITATMAEAAKQALLIQHDLSNRYAEEDAEAQILFLAEHQEIFDRIAQMDAEYFTVYGSRGEKLAKAHSFDIWKLELKTQKAAS